MIFRTNAPQPQDANTVKRYSFKLFALDAEIDLGPEATKTDLLRAINGHVLVGGELTGEQMGNITCSR